MDPISNLAKAYDIMERTIAAVPPEKWTNQSPCAEWDAKGVVNHVIGGAKMAAACVSGQEVDFASLAGDLAGDNPAASYRAAVNEALAAFRSDASVLGRMVKMPFGEMPGAVVAGIFINDNFGHAWDLAKASGQNTDIEPEFAAEVLASAKMFITNDLRTPGLFDAEKTSPAGASNADQVAAFMGRTV
jgi:uncharacterized protein (TIGR03086 family)